MEEGIRNGGMGMFLIRNRLEKYVSEEKKRRCPRCITTRVSKDGHDRNGKQMYECKKCGKKFSDVTDTPFSKMRTWPDAIKITMEIVLRGLSLRDAKEILEKMGISRSHVAIYMWLQKFGKLCRKWMRKHRPNYYREWYADETHYTCNGKKLYVWTMRDKKKNMIATHASSKRDARAAKKLLRKAIKNAGFKPDVLTTDKWDAYPPAIEELMPTTIHKHGAIKYRHTNNIMEGFFGTALKPRLRRFRGVKSFRAFNWFLEIYQFFYNYIRSHIGFGGLTPFEMSWLEA